MKKKESKKLLKEVIYRIIFPIFSPFYDIYLSLKYGCIVHPLAKVSIGTKIGKGAMIGHSILRSYRGKIVIGKNTKIYDNCELFAHRGASIIVGDNTFLAKRTIIFTADHVFSDKDKLIKDQGTVEGDVKIGNDVWIGYDVKIMKGITIGDGCVIGASSVVTKDLEPYSVAVGIPARVIKKRG